MSKWHGVLEKAWQRLSRRDLPEVPHDITHVHLLDTSVASSNVGDEIIVQSALRHLTPVLKDCYISTSSSHDGLGPSGLKLVKSADLVLLLGSNALAPFAHVGKPYIWQLTSQHVEAMAGKLVLVGVGANRSFTKVENKQKQILRKLLAPHHIHSVRDRSAEKIVQESGHSPINTSCPSLWGFAQRGPMVDKSKASRVTFTLTKHKPHQNDKIMVQQLRELYSEIYFWPQQPRDLSYLLSIGSDGIVIIPPNLAAYDEHLRNIETDVIGTRLHGSIRGLQMGRRTIVIAIDNRAEEIADEVGLPVVHRENLHTTLRTAIEEKDDISLRIPKSKIDQFTLGLSAALRPNPT